MYVRVVLMVITSTKKLQNVYYVQALAQLVHLPLNALVVLMVSLQLLLQLSVSVTAALLALNNVLLVFHKLLNACLVHKDTR